VGRPNVGKSTLLNALLGQKLVIVTPTPGTTRSAVLGVYVAEDPPTQIAFVDTPGLHRPKSALGKLLEKEAKAGLAGTDVILFLTEVRRGKEKPGPNEADERVLELALEAGRPIVLAVNKVDRQKDKRQLLPLLSTWQARHPFAAMVPISATERTNLDALVGAIRNELPEGLAYDPAELTDRPERFFAGELVREAILRHTRDEIPHGVAVLVEKFEERERDVHIQATIVVEKPSHKGIVIGAKGALLKKIGTEARLEIEKLIERKVFLELWVKVIEGWTRDPARARQVHAEESAR
jgi:GTP-binding protein Era